MSMIAIPVDQVIPPFFKHRSDAHGDGFLPAIQMAESADALARLGVFLVCAFLESADEDHHPQPLALGFSVARGWFDGRPLRYLVSYSHRFNSVDVKGLWPSKRTETWL